MSSSSLAIGVSVLIGTMLLHRKFHQSEQWHATVTPLASIIGSGFLIVAPLLHSVMGKWALLGIVLLSVFAYMLGWMMRYNIANAEPYLTLHPSSLISRIEKVSQWSLGIAYAISVAFYTSLFAAFIFEWFENDEPLIEKWITTILLLLIMCIAWLRGAKGLEWIELVAVTVKLAIILGVLAALLHFDINEGTAWFQHEAIVDIGIVETMSMLAGMLMVTQGFETARFMGEHFTPQQRINAVRYSQGIAIALYVMFIGLTCPIFLMFPIIELNETTISQTLGKAVWVLPFLLLIAATASQLSAALADTIGGGGLLKELVQLRLPANIYYLLIIGFALFLVWTANVFEIINLASKGFAFYYLMQVLIAISLVRQSITKSTLKYSEVVLLGGLAMGLVFVIGWSIPAPHS